MAASCATGPPQQPDGWEAFFDPVRSEWYYHHKERNITQWKRPLPEGWDEVFDESRQLTYYHNTLNNHVQWERPTELARATTSTAHEQPGRVVAQPEPEPGLQPQKQAEPAPSVPPSCGDNQFARNQSCQNCRPEQLSPQRALAPSAPVALPGDWCCPKCGDHQFARNTSCRLCGAPRLRREQATSENPSAVMEQATNENLSSPMEQATLENPWAEMIADSSTSASPVASWGCWQKTVPKGPPPSRRVWQPHVPCLLVEAVGSVLNDSMRSADGLYNGLYVDCTFGRGGHCREILKRLNQSGRLVAFDVDPEAVEVARRLERDDPRFKIMHRPFSDIGDVLLPGTVQGVLLDLGVSSPQLDDRHRGFTDREDAIADMRMNQKQGVSAAEWLRSSGVTAEELAWIINRYGEDSDPLLSERIAALIVEEQRRHAPLWTTKQLANLIQRLKPTDPGGMPPAKLTIQALRIWLNQEIDQLQAALQGACRVLTQGGRCCVITFKRTESEVLTRFVREHEEPEDFMLNMFEPSKLCELYPLLLASDKGFSLRQEAVIKPSRQEVEENNRSRSSAVHVIRKQARRTRCHSEAGPQRSMQERLQRPSSHLLTSFRGDADAPAVLDYAWVNAAPLRSAVAATPHPAESISAGSGVVLATPGLDPLPANDASQASLPIGSNPPGGTAVVLPPTQQLRPAQTPRPDAARAALEEAQFQSETHRDQTILDPWDGGPSTLTQGVYTPQGCQSGDVTPPKVMRVKRDFNFYPDSTKRETGGYLNLRCGDMVHISYEGTPYTEDDGWWYGFVSGEAHSPGWFDCVCVEPEEAFPAVAG